ncbi:MAG: hypothetical protein IPM98_12420 [Lewinellaceae bacterium]|nr:hypothetical protein [Lewinellaceae bacterium]
MRIKFTLLFFSLLFGSIISAQQTGDNWCGTHAESPWLDWYQRNTGIFSIADGGVDSAWLYVPMTLHIVGNNNGAGYFPLGNAINAVCEMNSAYEPARIRFYLLPGDAVRYHNNSSWYEHGWNDGSDMINTVIPDIRNRLNAFVVADPAGNCGYSWYDAIVLKSSCSGPGNTTWAHEAGHHFSLPHTFRGWEGFTWNYADPAPLKVNSRDVEKTDGTNCYVGGDRFCDTEPDYLNSRWPCNGDLRSNTVQHDPTGAAFRSDASLLMGYANDICSSRFTEEQIAAMRANLQSDEHNQYLQITAPLPELDDQAQVVLISPIDSSESMQYNHIELKWNKVPGARYYTVEISRTPEFPSTFFSETLVDSASLVVTKSMPNNWTLFWRVRAYSDWDVCQPYDQAQIGSFRTQNLSATNDLERSAIITLAPNPVMAGIAARLRIEAEQAMDVAVSLCDAAGRACYQQRYRLYAGENQFDIPTTNLSAGFYSMLVQNEKGATVKRLVVVE